MSWNQRSVMALLLLSGCLLSGPACTQSAEQIAARVVFAQGGVNIIRTTGEVVQAIRREVVWAGDSITTAADGSLQLRFSDGLLLSLRCDSKLLLVDYQYQDNRSDRIDLQLAQGSARIITGSIQRVNYVFRTALAEIRPTGTDFEVAVGQQSANYFAVYDGAINIKTQLGSVDVGGSTAFDFASADTNSSPAGLYIQPALLAGNSISQTVSGR